MIPTSTNVKFNVVSRVSVGVEALAVFATAGAKECEGADRLGEEERLAARRLLSSGVARGKAREVHIDLIGGSAADKPATSEYRRVLVAGLGAAEKVNGETLRQAAGSLGRSAVKYRLHDLVVVVPPSDEKKATTVADAVEAIVTGFLLASFHYTEYKGTAAKKKWAEAESRDAGEERKVRIITLLVDARDVATARDAMNRARVIADGQNFARTIASRPGNDINPPALARVAQEMAREAGLKCRVLDEKQMGRLGMGGILAVGRGSETPPRMIVLEHNVRKGAGAKAPIMVVGKAITFDTGGISIKPADRMGRMIFDKCGGMAVLGLMYAAAKLKLPISLAGILSSAENHIAGDSYRPGDILRMYNGVTVEVTNTDAEGRLVLGDALSWGIEEYKPAAVVDLATLTGAIIISLGNTIAGLMGNSDALAAELVGAGKRAGERMWQLPMGEEHREQIKSEAADIVNSAGRPASSLTAGAFISHFVPEHVPWAHLDIAGVADTEKELPYYAKGATGWGVRTLVNWASSRSVGAGNRVRKGTVRSTGGGA